MPAARRGIILPIVLLALVALALLSVLALHDAVQEWKVAALSEDAVLARGALAEGIDAARRPSDLAALCVLPALSTLHEAGPATGGGTWEARYSHLGDGLIRVRVSGRGRAGSGAAAEALMRPDSSDRSTGSHRCPEATGLVPAGPGWLSGSPGG